MWFIYSIDLYAWGFYSHKFKTFCNILAIFCLRVILRLLGTGSAQLWWSGGLLVQIPPWPCCPLAVAKENQRWPQCLSDVCQVPGSISSHRNTTVAQHSFGQLRSSWCFHSSPAPGEALGDEEKCPGQGVFKEKNNLELVQNLAGLHSPEHPVLSLVMPLFKNKQIFAIIYWHCMKSNASSNSFFLVFFIETRLSKKSVSIGNRTWGQFLPVWQFSSCDLLLGTAYSSPGPEQWRSQTKAAPTVGKGCWRSGPLP